MAAFLTAYGGTILVCLALAAVVSLVVRSMIRSKKAGKSSCGGNCAGCPHCGACHPNQPDS